MDKSTGGLNDYPAGQFFFIICLLAPLLSGLNKSNFIFSGISSSVFLAGMLMLATFHFFMIGQMKTLDRPGIVLFRGVYLFSGIISPNHGPASRELEKMIDHLTAHPQYVKLNITTDTFFKHPNKFFSCEIEDYYYNKMDIIVESAKEAIRAQPWKFISSYLNNIHFQFSSTFDVGPAKLPAVDPKNKVPDINLQYLDIAQLEKKKFALPKKTLAELRYLEKLGTPKPEEAAQQKRLSDYLDKVSVMFSSPYGNLLIGEVFRSLNFKYPSIFFLGLACLLLLIKYECLEFRLLILFLVPCFAIPFFSTMVDPFVHYRLPHDFHFILGGMAGIGIFCTDLWRRFYSVHVSEK